MCRVIIVVLFSMTTAVNVSPKFSFDQCLVSQPSLGYCVGVSALNKLQSIDNDPAYDIVDGVTFIRDEQRPRTLNNFLERDPGDFGGILDSMSHVVSYRTMRWDMSTLYPGLVMRVTPSVDGVLEFVMDPLQEDLTLKHGGQFKELGTARVLARQFLLPLLLGFKFKVATLIPILFGLLALLAKKALFLSKAALVVSSSLALGSLLFNGGAHSSPGHHGHYGGHYGGHHHGAHHHGGLGDILPSWTSHQAYKTDDNVGDFSDVMYKGYANSGGQDQIKFSGMNIPPQFVRDADGTGRNFAWDNAEKVMKVSNS